MDALAAALRDGAGPLLEQQYALFADGGRRAAENGGDATAAAAAACAAARAAGAGACPAAAAPSADGADPEQPPPHDPASLFPVPPPSQRLSLQADVAARLVEVQASLARDATAWKRGVLATPPAVLTLVRSSLALLDALAAVRLAAADESPAGGGREGCGRGAGAALDRARRPPSPLFLCTGVASGLLYHAYVVPTAPAVRSVLDAMRTATAAAAAHLEAVAATRHAGPPGCRAPHAAARRQRRAVTRELLRSALDDYTSKRLASIEAQSCARRAFVAAAAAAPRGSPAARAFACPDDTVRHLAFTCAFITANHKMVAACRAALAA